MKRIFQRIDRVGGWGVGTQLIASLALALVSISMFFVSNASLAYAATTTRTTSNSFHHVFGGFGIDTSNRANAAASDGVSESQYYREPADPSSLLGQTFQSLNMHEVDAYVWVLLGEYECHRSHVVPHSGASCATDYPNMTSVSVLLSYVQSHLQQVASNPLVNAYWVLDDWPAWDTGSAKPILQQIHALIKQYTPDIPAICGFGAEFDYNHKDYWSDSVAANFSPQGCDMVGLYNYSSILPIQVHPSSDSFDWSMSTLLPKMFSSLKQRGWSIAKEPLVGIGQAFGGVVSASQTQYYVTPNAQNMATQALSFCKHGASAVFFYSWDTGTDLVNPQTPMTNSTIEQGVRQGIAACKGLWGGH